MSRQPPLPLGSDEATSGGSDCHRCRCQSHDCPGSNCWSFCVSSAWEGSTPRKPDACPAAADSGVKQPGRLHAHDGVHQDGSSRVSRDGVGPAPTTDTSDYRPASVQPGSGSVAGDGSLPERQARELISNVQDYLRQCRSPLDGSGSSHRSRPADFNSVEFGTPEKAGAVSLSEVEVVRCAHSGDGSGVDRAGQVAVPSDTCLGDACQPLSTRRLRPIRQKTRNAVVGDVVVVR